MRYTKYYFALGIAAVALASASALTALAFKPMPATPNDAARLRRQLDETIRRELQDGCVETDEQGGKRFCRGSAAKVAAARTAAKEAEDGLKARPAELRATAVKNVRRFRGRDELRLDYQATSANPYRDDGSLIETYADDAGNEYWVDRATDALVQMGPAAGADTPAHETRPEDRLPVAALRTLALQYAEAAHPGFGQRLSSLHPLEDNKERQIYFFRWDDFSAPVRESELPPFIQVALQADGRLASFTDTLR